MTQIITFAPGSLKVLSDLQSDLQEEPPPGWVTPNSKYSSSSLQLHSDKIENTQSSTPQTNGLYSFLFTLLSFLIGWSSTLAWRSTDGLFLTYLGPDALTEAYCISSCCMIVLAVFLIKLMNRITAYQLLKTVLAIGTLLFVALSAAINFTSCHESSTFWFSIKIGTQIFSILSASAFWLFYDHHFAGRYSSKQYARVCCAAFVGYGFAGFLLHLNQCDAYSSFVAQCFLLVVSFVSTIYISKLAPNKESSPRLVKFKDSCSLGEYFTNLRKSPIACVLAGATLLLYILSTTAEYTYLYTFEDYYQSTSTEWVEATNTSGMTKSLGTCFALVGIGNMVTGLFLYCRCFLSLRALAWIAPIFAGSVYYFFCGQDCQLLYPAIGVLIVDGLYPLIEDNNISGLVGQAPSKLKQKVRLLIETFSEPVGMLFSTILIAFSSVSPTYLVSIVATFVIVVCFSLWIERLRRYNNHKHLSSPALAADDFEELKAG